MGVRRHGKGIKERRRTVRIAAQSLIAFYWTGGPPKPYRVRDISTGGAYIETGEHWSPGALIYLVLKGHGSQEPPGEDETNFGIWADVLRVDPGGMGLEFVFKNRQQQKEFQRFLEGVAGDFKE